MEKESGRTRRIVFRGDKSRLSTELAEAELASVTRGWQLYSYRTRAVVGRNI